MSRRGHETRKEKTILGIYDNQARPSININMTYEQSLDATVLGWPRVNSYAWTALELITPEIDHYAMDNYQRWKHAGRWELRERI